MKIKTIILLIKIIVKLMLIKIGEVENKVPNITDLIKKTAYDAKIKKEIENKYFITAHYNTKRDTIQ